MSFEYLKYRIAPDLAELKDAGLWKPERIIKSGQGAEITLEDGHRVLNFCANNYLGLANHPRVVRAAVEAMEHYSYGLSSVRFICGTLDIHKKLERRLADFLGMDDAILYVACFDANGGLFAPFFNSDDSAIITDALNHASIIDGVRLARDAKRLIYAHGDMNDLDSKLREVEDIPNKVIITDGVFSMDGDIAELRRIVRRGEAHGALIAVDDSHGTGVIGATGRGTPEHCGAKVDVVTSTLGKALGGGNGGFTAGPAEFIAKLRQCSRPYIFSNSVSPATVGASLAVLDILEESTELLDRLHENTRYFREELSGMGLEVRPGIHPIVPVMLPDDRLANPFAEALLDEGIYAIGFYYPIVPRGKARVRVQISADHTRDHLDRAVEAFGNV
ncbi:MAG TPA: glycine C-acetyltransferase, partial [candidate division Zixibacteria bacterium]|nr:glycine C-acetyltransferase [candidate division Zixibacteria bacterium]